MSERESLFIRTQRRIGLLPKQAAVLAPEDPEVRKRVDALEAAFEKVFQDRERSAEMIAEQNRRIREQDVHIRGLQQDKTEQAQQNIKLAQQISHVQGQLDATKHQAEVSQKEQGGRIGQLEHQVATLQKEAAQVPPLRDQVTKLQLLLNLYHAWGERIVKLLEENNVMAPPPPAVDFAQIEAQSRRLSQISDGG